jgi:nicotinamidase/pyrazinamidase
VKFSALDAKAMLPGVNIRFLEAASRGISPKDIAAAIEEMRAARVDVVEA